jgi:hypothetical protein
MKFKQRRTASNILTLLSAYLIALGCGQPTKTPSQETPPATSSTVAASPQKTADDGDTVRLSPDAFPGLPISVHTELKRRGCTIPQIYFPKDPSNVVKGHFTTNSQMDIAALCSRKAVSSILLFRNSSTSNISELAPAPDSQYLQDVGQGQIGFSRYLAPADSKYIQQHAEIDGGPKPPPIDHEGINDIFVEKGSTVWYWYNGKWEQLAGAD